MLFDFQIFLDFLGLVQGLLLGFLLIVLSNKKNKSTLFLGLFVVIFSLKLAYFIGKNMNIKGDYPELFLLPFNFSWFLFPLFIIYLHQVSVFSNRRPPYWTLLPGIILFLLQLYIYFQPYSIKLQIANLPLYEFFHIYIGILYSWSIAIWGLILLNKHRIEVHNSFSKIENKELHWARIFLIYSLFYSLVIHVLYFIDPANIYFKILFSIFDLISIYWIALYGISQHNIKSILNDINTNVDFNKKSLNKTKEQTASQVISAANMQEVMAQIDAFITSSESFTNSNLTIIDLSEDLKTHPKRISTIINAVRKQNFNSYINQFRIEKAVKLIESKELDNYSMEGIGIEVGFNSKSAFYASFKKVTSTTPTKYREHLVSS